MTKHPRAKCTLAALLSALLLLSSLAVALPVAAATGAAYHWNFGSEKDISTYHKNYWKTDGPSATNNRIVADEGVDTRIVAGGYNGSGYAMQLAYTKDAKTTEDYQNYSTFSLPNNLGKRVDGRNDGQTAYLHRGSAFRVTVTYKVTGYTSAARLYAVAGLGNLATVAKEFSIYYSVPVATITGATDWVTQSTLFLQPDKADSGFYLLLKMEDDTNRAGTTVLVGEVDVQPVDAVTVRFDAAGGTAVDPVAGMAGDTITYPAAPTRSGYRFAGWFTATGEAAPTVFPSADITLVAHWVEQKNTVSLAFNSVGGSSVDSIAGKPGDPIVAVQPVKAGYTFVGWFADKRCTVPVTVFPQENATLYAGWRPAAAKVQTYEDIGNVPTPLLSWGFEADENGGILEKYYDGAGNNSNNVGGQGAYARYMPAYGSGAHGGNGVMQLAYEENAASNTPAYTAAFSLCRSDAASTWKSPAGRMYRVAFWYKAENLTGNATLKVYSTSCNLRGQIPGADDNLAGGAAQATAAALPQAAAGTWQQASAVITSTGYEGGTGLYIVLEMEDTTQRAGTSVLIDDVRVSAFAVQDITGYGDAALSTGKNHTAAGRRSVSLTANNQPVHTANRVVFGTDTGDTLLSVGDAYTAAAWVLSPVEADVTLQLISESTVPAMGTAANSRLQDAVTLHLPADTWVQVRRTFVLTAEGETAYLAFGAAAAGSYTLYVDDTYVTAYTPDRTQQEDYEGFAVGTFAPDAADGVHGNAGGRTVSNEQNHTPNGGNALKLRMDSREPAAYGRTVLHLDQQDFAADVGSGYVVNFWAYSAQARTVHFVLGSTGDPTLQNSAVQVDEERGAAVDATLAAGEWQQIALTVPRVAGSGTAMTYLTLAAYTDDCAENNPQHVFIDDVTILDHVDYQGDPDTEAFETYTAGMVVGLPAYGGTFTVTKDANHSEGGAKSAMAIATTRSGATRPQLMVKNGAGSQVELEAGKNYRISFWAMIPGGQPNYSMRYWLAVTQDETPFTNNDQKNAAVIYETAGDTTVTAGRWTQFRVELPAVAKGGKLRLGVTTNTNDRVVFYVDDICVQEYTPVEFDPNATVWDFENYNAGDGSDFILNAQGRVVENLYNHTPNGSRALELETLTWGGTERNQLVLIDPATGKPYELEIGQEYVVSFWIYLPEEEAGSMVLNYWLLGTDAVATVQDKSKAEFDCGGQGYSMLAGEWVQIQTTITVRNGKHLILGTTDRASRATGTTYYLDDISVMPPQYVTVRFDTNGSADTFPDVCAVVGMPMPLPEVDPYLEGYEFTGWYTDKACTPESLFDTENGRVTGKNGDVLTLYAGWQRWKERPSSDSSDEPRYRTEYYPERVWVGDQNVIEPLEFGESPTLGDAAPVSKTPDKQPADEKTAEGMKTWMILVIVAAAVAVVGGGAAATLLLLRKKKKA